MATRSGILAWEVLRTEGTLSVLVATVHEAAKEPDMTGHTHTPQIRGAGQSPEM